MNANCPRSSLPIRLLQRGRRKSYRHNGGSDQQKGQLEANAAFSLDTYYICIFVVIKTQQTRALPSLLPPLIKSNATMAKVAAADLAVVPFKEFLPLSERCCSLCSWSRKRPGSACYFVGLHSALTQLRRGGGGGNPTGTVLTCQRLLTRSSCADTNFASSQSCLPASTKILSMQLVLPFF